MRSVRRLLFVVAVVAAGLPAAASPSAAQESGAIGYVGCSVTLDAVNGYRALGGTRVWEFVEGYQGTLFPWSSEKANLPLWATFERLRAEHPDTGQVWWQLCRADDEGDKTDDELHALAVSILQQLRQRIGDMPVYATPTAMYSEGHVCKGSGADGPARMATLVDRLVGEGVVMRGPLFPTLEDSVLRDRCHGNEEGQRIMGGALKQFFDGAPAYVPAEPSAPAPTAAPNGPGPSGTKGATSGATSTTAAGSAAPGPAEAPGGGSSGSGSDTGWWLAVVAALVGGVGVGAVVSMRRSRRARVAAGGAAKGP